MYITLFVIIMLFIFDCVLVIYKIILVFTCLIIMFVLYLRYGCTAFTILEVRKQV